MDDQLLQKQRELGGIAADEGGLLRIARFGDLAAERDALQRGVAVFDLTGMTQIDLTGRDRAKFLHNFCTNDIKALEVGRACEAYVTNVKARVLAHIVVACLDDRLTLLADAGIEETLAGHLDRYLITEDVEIHPRSTSRSAFVIAGPRVNDLLARLNLPDATGDGLQCGVMTDPAATFVRPWIVGTNSVLLSVDRDPAADVWQRLIESGGQASGGEVYETLRLMSGVPRSGVDVDETVLAPEAGRIERTISYRKGCYLGQEPIARIDALGHVNRELTRVRLTSLPANLPAAVLDPGTGKEVGRLTSAAMLPEGGAIGLGLIRRSHIAEGTTLRVDGVEGPVTASRDFGLM